jgi:formate/nitrite transporter FocA (FNT family)
MIESEKEVEENIKKPKNVNQILNEQIAIGLHEHRRSRLGSFLSGVSAGLEVGFSIFLMAILYSMFSKNLDENQLHLVLAAAYPVGFIFTVIGKSELFAEHTTLAVIPVLNGNATVKSLLLLWGIVYSGNLIGGYVFGSMLNYFSPVLKIIKVESFIFFAEKLIDFEWHVMLGSAVLAGWLMGLLSWLVTSATETTSRILIVALITSLIGLGGLHHSIVGSIEVFVGFLTSDTIGFTDYLYFQSLTTIGNAIGGVFFVAIIKYSHTVRSN